jgi:superfamily II DNA or RNA helicase
VLEKLRSVKWDLVIIDEAHRNLAFIERLLPELSDARVLLLTASDLLPAGQLSSRFDLTQWRTDELRVRTSSSETPIYYERSAEEKTVLECVASLAAELKENDEARLFLRIVGQAASSSVNALEQLLTRQLGVLRDVSAADSRLAGMPEDVVTRDLDLPVAAWKDRGAATKALLSTLDAIGKTSTDEKLATLCRLIEDLVRPRRRYGIWIVTSFRATAWYLNSSLLERGWRVNVLTADMPYSRAVELTNILHQDQSILIATLASTKGLELPAVTHVVLYDEPRSPIAQHFITARVPATALLEVFAFHERQSV